MFWRQYDQLSDDLRNIAFKATFAPIFRRIGASRTCNQLLNLPRRIVICGCPRSGTTLMNELLRSFGDVFVLEREERALRFPYLIVGKPVVATKHPLDFRNLGEISQTYDDAKILFLVRDPRDVVVSKHFKYPDKYFVEFRLWKEAINRYEAASDIDKYLVKYEHLISQPDSMQESLAEFLKLKPCRSFTDFHKRVNSTHQDIKSLGALRPIDCKNTGKYRLPEHFDRISSQLTEYPEMGEYLIRYGYESDDSWASVYKSRSNAF